MAIPMLDILMKNLKDRKCEFVKIRKFILVIIFVIFFENDNLRSRNENFEISRNLAYSCLENDLKKSPKSPSIINQSRNF